MSKVITVLLCFCCILCIFHYGSDKRLDLREIILDCSENVEFPKMPNIGDYDISFVSYSDYSDSADVSGIFARIGCFFSWIGDIFVQLWKVITFCFGWIVYFCKTLFSATTLVAKFFGGVISV